MDYYIGVDLGTTAVKVVLFDSTGRPVCEESEEVGLAYGAGGRIDQKPECWYEIPCALIERASRGVDREKIRAIGVSSQGISVVPVGKDGKPLADGISWLDTRAEKELEEVLSVVSADEIFDLTGKHPSALYTLPKLLWMKKYAPEAFEKAEKFLMPLDYLTFRLCGSAVTDATMAGGTMLYGLYGAEWSEKLCDTFGIPIGKLPTTLKTGTLAGFLNEESCARTGLSGKTAVAVGAQDQKIAAYGIGIERGFATVSLGTAGAIEILSDGKSDTLPSFRFDTADGSGYMLEGCVNTFGAAIKWARNTVFPDLSYKEMDALAETAPAGSGGVCFCPHLSGVSTPHYGENVASGWKNLSLGTTRAEMIRSVYEGLACEIRLNLDAAEAAGAKIGKLALFGGTAKSAIVCQTISDVCGLEVRSLSFSEMSAFGAAKSAFACVDPEGAKTFTADGGCKVYLSDAGRGERIFRQYVNSAE